MKMNTALLKPSDFSNMMKIAEKELTKLEVKLGRAILEVKMLEKRIEGTHACITEMGKELTKLEVNLGKEWELRE